MSSVIKGDLLGNALRGVYVIDPTPSTKVEQVETVNEPTAEEKAAVIISDAQAQAAALVQAACVEAEQIKETARQEGYDAGYKELEAERSSCGEKLAEIEAGLEENVDSYFTALEPEVVTLAIAIARQVVKREIESDKEFVLGTIRSGLRQLRERHEIKVRVNPADYDLVRAHKEDIASSCDGIRSIEIIDDRRVDAGGCIIDSANGYLDGRIDTQISEVERTLMDAARDGRNEEISESE